jgi:long-chain acyl-CoA synthetase
MPTTTTTTASTSFITQFFDNLGRYAYRSLITEVGEGALSPTTGAALAKLVGAARGALRARGVGVGERVVLVAANSARWLAADLAMLAEGLVTVPLYARQDVGELAGMIRDCDPALVVCADEGLASAVGGAMAARGVAAPVITHEALFSGPLVEEPPLARAPDDIVTIIYTSGTSGEPKGAMMSVAGVDFMLGQICHAITELMGERGVAERVFHYLPFCFAGSRMVLWMTLLRGKNLMISTNLDKLIDEVKLAAPHYFLNVPRVLERIRAAVDKKLRTAQPKPITALYVKALDAWGRASAGRATWLDRAAIAAAQRLLFRKVKQQIGANLECFLCGSAPLSEETQQWFHMIGLPIYQIYGLTETTAIVTMDRPQQNLPGFVGHVLDGVQVKLGDADELLVKGPNIFPGYWRRPAQTAEAFDADGWFRTGDQVLFNDQGNLKVIGRVKNILVLTNGHNVPPEPIEEQLLEHIPGAEQAVVFGHGRAFLTAVLTGSPSPQAVEAGIKAVNASLPHYRRVRAFHISPDLLTPENGLLTANMKLRRRVIEAHFKPQLDALYANPPAAGGE